jgi:hypothetical protein
MMAFFSAAANDPGLKELDEKSDADEHPDRPLDQRVSRLMEKKPWLHNRE